MIFLAEYPLKTATKANISVDGALLHELRMPLGCWEAKDANDNLDDAVAVLWRSAAGPSSLVNGLSTAWALQITPAQRM